MSQRQRHVWVLREGNRFHPVAEWNPARRDPLGVAALHVLDSREEATKIQAQLQADPTRPPVPDDQPLPPPPGAINPIF